jgi:hypothetical protein
MKKLRLKQGVKDFLGIMLFITVIIGGLFLVSDKQEKSVATEVTTQHTNVN